MSLLSLESIQAELDFYHENSYSIDEFVSEEKTPTMDIDEALSDLMNTKEYNFKD